MSNNIQTKDMSALGSFSINSIAKSIAFCYVITIILMAVFAIVVTYTPVSEGIVPMIVLVITIFSIMLSGIIVARTAQSKGWLCGAVSGIIYIVTLNIFGSLIFQSFSFGTGFLTMLLIGVFSGAFGGIIGVNSRR